MGITINKKGMYFTLMTIFFIGIFTFLFLAPSYSRLQEKMFVTEMRIESMNNLIKDIQRDSQRGLYISSYRALLALEEKIIINGTFLDSTEERFLEAVMNGTVYGKDSSLMAQSTFPEWVEKIKEDTRKFNVNIDVAVLNIEVYQEDPWSVSVSSNLTLSIADVTGLASWSRSELIKSKVSIIDFEDPMYIVNSYGRISNTIISTPYDGNYTYDSGEGKNIDNLLDHLDNSYYTSNPDAPSFLMRLENNISASPHGIESLVNLKELDDLGLNISYDSSVVDHYYWYDVGNGDYRVNSTPTWFRLDVNHLEKYEVEDISYLE